MALVWQQPLPEIYTQLSDAELRLRIESAREALAATGSATPPAVNATVTAAIMSFFIPPASPTLGPPYL